MTSEEEKFLDVVRNYINKNPHMLAATIVATQDGIESRLRRERAFAIDMETVAAMALNARMFKSQGPYIAQLLRKHENVAALKWTEVLAKLEDSK